MFLDDETGLSCDSKDLPARPLFTSNLLLDVYENQCEGWRDLLAAHQRTGRAPFLALFEKWKAELEVERIHLLRTGELPPRQRHDVVC